MKYPDRYIYDIYNYKTVSDYSKCWKIQPICSVRNNCYIFIFCTVFL